MTISCRQCGKVPSDVELNQILETLIITGKVPPCTCEGGTGLLVEKYIGTSNAKTLSEMKVRDKKYGDKCPKCGEKGKTNVMPSIGGFWFCENPECPVNRHFSSGYYIIVKSDKKPVIGVMKNPDDVQLVSANGRRKRLVR